MIEVRQAKRWNYVLEADSVFQSVSKTSNMLTGPILSFLPMQDPGPARASVCPSDTSKVKMANQSCRMWVLRRKHEAVIVDLIVAQGMLELLATDADKGIMDLL